MSCILNIDWWRPSINYLLVLMGSFISEYKCLCFPDYLVSWAFKANSEMIFNIYNCFSWIRISITSFLLKRNISIVILKARVVSLPCKFWVYSFVLKKEVTFSLNDPISSCYKTWTNKVNNNKFILINKIPNKNKFILKKIPLILNILLTLKIIYLKDILKITRLYYP